MNFFRAYSRHAVNNHSDEFYYLVICDAHAIFS